MGAGNFAYNRDPFGSTNFDGTLQYFSYSYGLLGILCFFALLLPSILFLLRSILVALSISPGFKPFTGTLLSTSFVVPV